jgi:hypothetical protein
MLSLWKLRESDYVANMVPEPSTFALSSAPSSLSLRFSSRRTRKNYMCRIIQLWRRFRRSCVIHRFKKILKGPRKCLWCETLAFASGRPSRTRRASCKFLFRYIFIPYLQLVPSVSWGNLPCRSLSRATYTSPRPICLRGVCRDELYICLSLAHRTTDGYKAPLFSRVRKVPKNAYYLHHVCLYVRLHASARLPLVGFPWKLILGGINENMSRKIQIGLKTGKKYRALYMNT